MGVVLLAAFALWERRIDHPMLDVTFFKNPRFTAASGSITLVFFAMFGALFLLTQYFQYVLGYTPLETGIRMLPFAAAMMITSPLSARIVERIGTKFTVALGLGLVTAGLLTMTGLQADTPYSNIFWRLMLMAAGMGLTMAPATESVMGSLPLAKAGVGSAVNDTTRQVGGALGVAIVGSVLASVYGDKISSFLTSNGVTGPVVDAARNTIGAIPAVADQLSSSGQTELAGQVQETANSAFVQAAHWGVAVAALATGIGVVVALLFLPARAREEDSEEQLDEYVAEHADEFTLPTGASAVVATDLPTDATGLPGSASRRSGPELA